jgi:glycosyltransferase involved in cell wall biosynthesis
MRICFIAVGRFNHIGPYLDYFKAAGHDVHFISLSLSPDRGVSTYNLGFGKTYSETQGKWKYPISMLRARRLIRRLKPDVIHAHYATSAGLAAVVSGFHPSIVTVHGSDLTMGIRSPVWRPLLRLIFRHVDCVNTVSDDLRDMVLSLGISDSKIETLTLGIDTAKFSFVAKSLVNNSQELKLVCTRRLEPVFQHQTIVRALALLKNNAVKFKATFVGDGSLRAELERLVRDCGLADDVKFSGRIDNNCLPEVLLDHDIYLSASLWDGTSLSLLEAMASGLFPVVSDIRANSAWLKPGVDGLLHKVGDAEDLARCIMQVLDQPALAARVVQANRQRVVERGDRNKNMKRLEDLYARLVNKAT